MTNCEICSTLAAEDVEQEIAAAVAAEREACAKVAEERVAHLKEWEQQPHPDNPDEAAEAFGGWATAEYIAAKIRARAGEEVVMAETTDFEEWKAEEMKDPEFRAAFEKLKPVFDLSASILRLRIARGWSLHELAKHAGVRECRLTKVEMSNGGNPNLRFLQKLARALDARVVMLLEPKEAASP